MNKREKILVGLAAVAFFLILYLVMTSETINVQNGNRPLNQASNQSKSVKVDLAKLERDYKKKIREIFFQAKDVVEETELNSELAESRIVDLKQRAMNLTVPAEYRAFHVSLVFFLDKIINNDFAVELSPEEEVERILEENQWLGQQ